VEFIHTKKWKNPWKNGDGKRKNKKSKNLEIEKNGM